MEVYDLIQDFASLLGKLRLFSNPSLEDCRAKARFAAHVDNCVLLKWQLSCAQSPKAVTFGRAAMEPSHCRWQRDLEVRAPAFNLFKQALAVMVTEEEGCVSASRPLGEGILRVADATVTGARKPENSNVGMFCPIECWNVLSIFGFFGCFRIFENFWASKNPEHWKHSIFTIIGFLCVFLSLWNFGIFACPRNQKV